MVDTGMAPRALAEKLKPLLESHPAVTAVEIAGPGFINLRLKPEHWQQQVAVILRAGKAYGDSDIGQGEPVNVEYVSANPTGPMHVGHCRGAVFGDALAALLDKAGFGVVPFGAFGVPGDLGWMRLSIGAVSVAEIESGLARISDALQSLG